MSGHPLEGSLISVIGGEDGKDLLKEAAEFSLDRFVKDGWLRDIPIVGTVASLYAIAIGAQGYVFAKKVRKFLTELSSIPLEKRLQFAEEVHQDDDKKTLVADTLLILLDRLDEMQKAPMLARAFGAYIQEKIDLPTFRRLAMAIDWTCPASVDR